MGCWIDFGCIPTQLSSTSTLAYLFHEDFSLPIFSVLAGLPKDAITRAVIMDHLYVCHLASSSSPIHSQPCGGHIVPFSDWFAPGAGEVDEEVAELHRALAAGGMVFWRSAARYPWYNEVFERAGFEVEILGMREGPKKAIDRVNMCVVCPYSLFHFLMKPIFDDHGTCMAGTLRSGKRRSPVRRKLI